MLATAWPFFANTQSTTQQYLPARPSPLSPRSANACPRPHLWGRTSVMSPSSKSNTSGSENDVPFSKRDIKANPVLKRAKQSPDEARERRREIFMKKVEKGREDKKWNGRTDQILRSDYLAQRRQWEQERDREAHWFDISNYDQSDDVSVYHDDEQEMQWPSTPRLRALPDDAQEVDEIAQMEEEELRELLALQDQEQASAMQDVPSSPTRYGSDDEDYDDIFMEYLSSQQPREPSGQGSATIEAQEDSEMMDTT